MKDILQRLSWLLIAALGATGCHEPFSNDDLLFLKATPSGLRIDIPEETARALRAAQDGDANTPARFYRDTLRAAQQVNRGLFELLDVVGQVTMEPPTVREEDLRFWGPIPVSETTVLGLVVQRTRTATVVEFVSGRGPIEADQIFDYQMLARRPGETDAHWIPLFAGRSLPQTSDRQGAGVLYLDLTVFRQFVDGADGDGVLAMAYDTRDDQVAIELYADTDREEPFVARSGWRYEAVPGVGGDFLYFIRESLFGTPRPELLAVAASWLDAGRGRADVFVNEGDLAGRDPLFAIECWNDAFRRTYLLSNIEEPGFELFGDIAACGPEFQTSRFPD